MMLIDLMKFCCRNLYLWLLLYIYITLCGLYVPKNCYVPNNCSNFVQQHAIFYICKEIATTNIMSLVKYGCRRKREKRKSLPNSSKVFFGCRLLLYAIFAVLVISISGDVELQTSQGYIIRILQHFATKLWNITIGCPKVRVEIFTLARGARACIESTQFK